LVAIPGIYLLRKKIKERKRRRIKEEEAIQNDFDGGGKL